MAIAFPYSADTTRILNDFHTPKDTNHMNAFVHAHEIHINAAQQRRFEEAMQSERIKLARRGRQDRNASILAAVRRAIGSMLISAGQRINRETAPPNEAPFLKRRVAGIA